MTKHDLISLLMSARNEREWHTLLLDVCDRHFGGVLPEFWDEIVAEGHIRRFEERARKKDKIPA